MTCITGIQTFPFIFLRKRNNYKCYYKILLLLRFSVKRSALVCLCLRLIFVSSLLRDCVLICLTNAHVGVGSLGGLQSLLLLPRGALRVSGGGPAFLLACAALMREMFVATPSFHLARAVAYVWLHRFHHFPRPRASFTV